MELMAQGFSITAAAREAGVSRTSGYIWKYGTTVARKDGTVKVVPPLEPLALRVISPRFLSQDERIQIADLASKGSGPTAIAAVLHRAPSTISRELARNTHPSGQYRPFHAHSAAATRRRPAYFLTGADNVATKDRNHCAASASDSNVADRCRPTHAIHVRNIRLVPCTRPGPGAPKESSDVEAKPRRDMGVAWMHPANCDSPLRTGASARLRSDSCERVAPRPPGAVVPYSADARFAQRGSHQECSIGCSYLASPEML